MQLIKGMVVGILSLQGCVEPHQKHLEALGVESREIKSAGDCCGVDRYILPGGESSTMLRLMKVFSLEEVLTEEFKVKPVWGICAGAILMGKSVENVQQNSFGLMDYSIKRNGYGRQLESREEEIDGYGVSFIRAPILGDLGESVEVIASKEKRPVWVRSGKYMATTFHPELNTAMPSPMHQSFVELS